MYKSRSSLQIAKNKYNDFTLQDFQFNNTNKVISYAKGRHITIEDQNTVIQKRTLEPFCDLINEYSKPIEFSFNKEICTALSEYSENTNKRNIQDLMFYLDYGFDRIGLI